LEIDVMIAFEECEKGLALSSIEDSDFLNSIKILLEKNYIKLENNFIYQTLKGVEALGDFCSACECLPCDCNWGN